MRGKRMSERQSEAFGIFHMLWSRAPSDATYCKADWKLVERLVTGQDSMHGEAVMAFDRLVKLARQRLVYDLEGWRTLAAFLKLERHLDDAAPPQQLEPRACRLPS